MGGQALATHFPLSNIQAFLLLYQMKVFPHDLLYKQPQKSGF